MWLQKSEELCFAGEDLMKSALKCLQCWDAFILLALLSYKIKIKMFQFVSS